MTEHTPGPWHVGPHAGRGIWIDNAVDALSIAFIDSEFRHSREEAMANARLIAAGPDLLAALEAIANSVTPYDIEAADGYDDTEGAETYGLLLGMGEMATIARAAIAQARGQ